MSTWVTDENGVVHIPLGDGFEALIFDRHKEKAANFYWRHKITRKKNVVKHYAEASVIEELREKYGKYTSLHRVVADAPKDTEVDHKDGNGLDCRDFNLRLANSSQNSSNRHYQNSTGYRGVVRRLRCKNKPFAAQIEKDGKNRFIGGFVTAIEAAIAYNREALRVFGDFAILNVVPEEQSCRQS